MSEDMNLSVNGQSQVPPGFRFHPTEEELLHYYLRKKVASQKIDLEVIRDVDLNKLEPWDIQEKCKIGSTQNDWYFFSHKDKKYPTGTRTNRATAAGFWKATGRDKAIYSNFRKIGMRKTLVFYKGRAPHGQKSDWIMHEYRLEDNTSTSHYASASNLVGESTTSEEGWVVCRVFKKKNYHRALDSPQSSSTSMGVTHMSNSTTKDDRVLDQIFVYMGKPCKDENETIGNINMIDSDNNMQFLTPIITTAIGYDFPVRFAHLPRLASTPTMPSIDELVTETEPSCTDHRVLSTACKTSMVDHQIDGFTDWAALDRLVASQLNGPVEGSKKLCSYGEPNDDFCYIIDQDLHMPHLGSTRPSQASQAYSSEIDLWSFTRSMSSSSSDPLGHLSV